MKIGVIAELLGKSAQELSSALNLEAGAEVVPEDVALKVLKSHISDIEKGNFSKGKDEGFKWGEKQAKTGVEKMLKEKFEVEGDLDSQIAALTTKVQPGDDKKLSSLQREVELRNEKLKALQNEFDSYKEGIQKRENQNFLISKLNPVLDHFDSPTPKMKELVVAGFLESVNYERAENDIFLLDKDGKPLKKGDSFVGFENYALEYFSEYLPKKAGGKTPPGTPPAGGTPPAVNGTTMNELMVELRGAKTAEQRTAIHARIKALEKAS